MFLVFYRVHNSSVDPLCFYCFTAMLLKLNPPVLVKVLSPFKRQEKGERSSTIARIMPLQGMGGWLSAFPGVLSIRARVWGIWGALQIVWQSSPRLERSDFCFNRIRNFHFFPAVRSSAKHSAGLPKPPLEGLV